MIILEREAPQKEFTAKDSGYPSNYVDGFPDDFTGVDIGKRRVWIRGDLMNKIPLYFRATSLQDADILVIAENEYYWSGTLSVTTFADEDNDAEVPTFDTVEELEAYIASHQPKIEAITYYPKFSVYDLVDIYSVKTGICSVYDYQYTGAKRFASNPEAGDQLYDMELFYNVMASFADESTSAETLICLVNELDFVQESKRNLWTSCITSGESATALYSMEEYLWSMAKVLSGLDPSASNQENYAMIIQARDLNALFSFADYCNYSGFDR